MRHRLLLPALVLPLLGLGVTACVERPVRSGCWYWVPTGFKVSGGTNCAPILPLAVPPETAPGQGSTVPDTAPVGTEPIDTTPVDTAPDGSTTTISTPASGLTASVVCIPGTPSALRFTGTAPIGANVRIDQPTPYVWNYTLPGSPVPTDIEGGWLLDVNFGADPTLFPFSARVTDSTGGATTVSLAEGC